MEKQKALNLLGMAYRARMVINGYDSVMDAIIKGKAKIVLIANDASDKTIEAFDKKCFYYKIDMCQVFDSLELSKAIGKGLVKVLAISDEGFTKSLKKLLSEV